MNQPNLDFKEINGKEPIGIIQLINKKDFRQINDYDKKKFKAIQALIGLSIDNTQEYSSVINIRLGMYRHLRGIIDGLRTFQTLAIPATAADALEDDSISGISYHDVETIYQSKRMIEKMIREFEQSKELLLKEIGEP